MKTTNIAILTFFCSLVFFACQKEPTDYLSGIYNVTYTSSYYGDKPNVGYVFEYDTINNAYLEIIQTESNHYQLNLFRDYARQDTVFYNDFSGFFEVRDKPADNCDDYNHLNYIPNYTYYSSIRKEFKIQDCDSLFFKFTDTHQYLSNYSQRIQSYRGVKLD